MDESASESLLVSMDTITSFIPEDFSWEDSNSSGRTRNKRTDGGRETEEEEKISFTFQNIKIDIVYHSVT